ncbi:Hypothetical protein CINCED_3A022297, partial [Cinara cedri]
APGSNEVVYLSNMSVTSIEEEFQSVLLRDWRSHESLTMFRRPLPRRCTAVRRSRNFTPTN